MLDHIAVNVRKHSLYTVVHLLMDMFGISKAYEIQMMH